MIFHYSCRLEFNQFQRKFCKVPIYNKEIFAMFKIGYAQEIITPPTGVGLAGYFNKRPNQGMYDDLYVKVVIIESQNKKFGFMTFDLCSLRE